MLNPATAISLAQQHARAGNHAEAERIYRQLLQNSPNNAVAWHNLGMACYLQKRPDEAIEALQKAIEIRGDYVEAINNLGAVLSAQNRVDEAVQVFRKAIEQKPRWVEPMMNIGNTLRNHNRFDEAIEAYRQAVAADPKSVDAHHYLASALGRQGLRELSLQHYYEALRLKPSDVVIHSSLLLVLSYEPDLTPEIVLNEHKWWDRLHGQGLAPVRPHTNVRDPDRKLRVGYVSSDFRTHPVARFMLPIYESHDRANFEIYSYAQMFKFDAISDRFRAQSSGWRITYGKTDPQIAEMVRDDGIDILVDLAGHTGGNRISAFTYRGAPVQATYLGYPNTSGLKSIQYRITDAVIDPPGQEQSYTEQLVRLPGVWCCYQPPADAPELSAPPSEKNGFITFGCMQNLLKLNEGVIELWSRVMKAIPDSRLRIYRNTLDGMARKNIAEKLQRHGITGDRFDLDNVSEDGSGHLAKYAEVDISLDTQPWSGHATTCETLWMGVPMLTLRGTRGSGRMSASILAAVGLDDLIAQTADDFVAIAVRAASEPARLASLRAGLRERMRQSKLCDATHFTAHFESALREMWRRWCAAESSQ
jgi:predicted O-linked N-acetylglucosamine transferase (SPINDLY family)